MQIMVLVMDIWQNMKGKFVLILFFMLLSSILYEKQS